MREQDRLCTFPLVVLTVLLFASMTVLTLFGGQSLLSDAVAAVAPISALAVGLFGMYFFMPRGFFKEDRFHVMFVLIAIGLVVLAMAEVAGAVIEFFPNSEVFLFIVGILQITAFVPMVIGILRYLHGINQTLGYPSPRVLWSVAVILPLVLVSALSSIALVTLVVDHLIDWLTSVAVSIVSGFIVFSLAGITLIFLKGKMLYPIGTLLAGMVLFFVRCMLWCTLGIGPVDVVSRLLGIGSYLMLGLAISLAVSMESF